MGATRTPRRATLDLPQTGLPQPLAPDSGSTSDWLAGWGQSLNRSEHLSFLFLPFTIVLARVVDCTWYSLLLRTQCGEKSRRMPRRRRGFSAARPLSTTSSVLCVRVCTGTLAGMELLKRVRARQ